MLGKFSSPTCGLRRLFCDALRLFLGNPFWGAAPADADAPVDTGVVITGVVITGVVITGVVIFNFV
jgi:hypothetical protein